jgi:hypothetical protein
MACPYVSEKILIPHHLSLLQDNVARLFVIKVQIAQGCLLVNTYA